MINDYEATQPITSGSDSTYASTTSNDDVISTLNSLIQTVKDGEEGFRDAGENVQASNLKTLFYESSQERSRFVGELQALVRSLGGDPEDSGSILGAVHRGWIDLKTAISTNDETGILSECERGEDSAKKAYKDALAKSLPANVLGVVRTQSEAVFASHDRIKALRDSSNTDSTSTAATI